MNCEFVTDQSTKYETRRKQPRAKWHYTIWPQIALYNVSECGLGRCCFGIQNHPQRRKTTNVSKKHTLQVWNWYSASALALSEDASDVKNPFRIYTSNVESFLMDGRRLHLEYRKFMMCILCARWSLREVCGWIWVDTFGKHEYIRAISFVRYL